MKFKTNTEKNKKYMYIITVLGSTGKILKAFMGAILVREDNNLLRNPSSRSWTGIRGQIPIYGKIPVKTGCLPTLYY